MTQITIAGVTYYVLSDDLIETSGQDKKGSLRFRAVVVTN